MKKWIALTLALLTVSTNQLFAYQYTSGPTIVFADVLLWKLREGSADNWGQIITPADVNQKVTLLEVPFNWQAGFRLGLGRKALDSAWDVLIAYTDYQTKKTAHTGVTSGGIYSAYLGNFYAGNPNGANFGPNYRNANIEWTFTFRTVDIEYGRNYHIDSIVKLRPKVGLKSAVINQHINTNWQNPNAPSNFTMATENLKNLFWGIGPYLGFDSAWFIYGNDKRGLNLFGNVTAGLLSGHWRFKDRYENNTPLSITVNSDSINTAATLATGQFGVEWMGHILNSEAKLRLGYEAQVWFNQVQYYSFNMGRLDNLMSLQGGLLDFFVHF